MIKKILLRLGLCCISAIIVLLLFVVISLPIIAAYCYSEGPGWLRTGGGTPVIISTFLSMVICLAFVFFLVLCTEDISKKINQIN